MILDYVTIFPDFFAPLQLSLPGKAADKGLVDFRVHDLRGYTHDRHRTVDDTPYGGGAGMVMKPEPWGEAFDDLVPDGQGAGSGTTRVLSRISRAPVQRLRSQSRSSRRSSTRSRRRPPKQQPARPWLMAPPVRPRARLRSTRCRRPRPTTRCAAS